MSVMKQWRWALVLLVLGCGLSSRGWAAEVWHTSAIRQVYVLGSGAFVLTLATESTQCTNANTPYKYYYVTAGQNGMTAEGVRNALALALAAAAQGIDITFVYDNATSGCYVNRLLSQHAP